MAPPLQKISVGSLGKITAGEDLPCPLYFQVVGSKRVPSTNDQPDRCRLMISDGIETHGFAMLSAPLNERFMKGEFDNFAIIRLDRYCPSRVNRQGPNDKNVIILFDITTIHSGTEVGKRILPEGVSQPPSTALSAPVPNAQKENVNGNSKFSSNSSSNQNHYAGGNTSLNSSVMGDLSEHLTMPIDTLSPYQNKWIIKARVTAKSAIRTWKNPKGEGKLFNMDLCDETGEIRCTAFRDMVDRYYDLIEIDKVYYISRCTLKPANKQFSKLKNDYEMTMNNDTVIQLCSEDTSSIPKLKFNLVSITDLAEKSKDEIVDVLGVCREVSAVTNIIARSTGQQLTKREVTLVDQTNASIVLTLWGAEAENFNGFDNPVVLAKGVRIGEFGGGKTLGTMVSSTLLVNPEMPEAHHLKGWYDNTGLNSTYVGLSNRTTGGNMATEWVTFNDSVKKQLGQEKPDYFQTMGMIHTVRAENMIYKACPNENCNKKVIDSGSGSYRCEKCNSESVNFSNRMLVSMMIGDWTSNRWVTAFGNIGEKIFGKTTDELANIMENDKAELDSVINECLFKPHIFKLRTRTETYGDIPRNKVTVIAVGETKIRDYNAHMIANIRKLTGIQKA